jgi:hypothetical protein
MNLEAFISCLFSSCFQTTITQVLHVPKMKNNLMSVSELISEGFKVEFDKDGCKVNDA